MPKTVGGRSSLYFAWPSLTSSHLRQHASGRRGPRRCRRSAGRPRCARRCSATRRPCRSPCPAAAARFRRAARWSARPWRGPGCPWRPWPRRSGRRGSCCTTTCGSLPPSISTGRCSHSPGRNCFGLGRQLELGQAGLVGLDGDATACPSPSAPSQTLTSQPGPGCRRDRWRPRRRGFPGRAPAGRFGNQADLHRLIADRDRSC